MPYNGAMQWLMALATGDPSPLRQWFLAGPWVETATDPELTAYEAHVDGEDWIVLQQKLPAVDEQVRWRARELAEHCGCTVVCSIGAADEDPWVVGGDHETAPGGRFSASVETATAADPLWQLRLDDRAQQERFRQLPRELCQLVERRLPVREGRGRLRCAAHRVVEPGRWTAGTERYEGRLAATLQLEVYDERGEEVRGIREQEIALCTFPWLSSDATFLLDGDECRLPANEVAGACLADVERLLTETIPGQLRAVDDWARTTPKDIVRPPST